MSLRRQTRSPSIQPLPQPASTRRIDEPPGPASTRKMIDARDSGRSFRVESDLPLLWEKGDIILDLYEVKKRIENRRYGHRLPGAPQELESRPGRQDSARRADRHRSRPGDLHK